MLGFIKGKNEAHQNDAVGLVNIAREPGGEERTGGRKAHLAPRKRARF